MAEWARHTGSLERRGYLITEDDGPDRRWRLEMPSSLLRSGPPVVSRHTSLRLAMDHAANDERVRLRRLSAWIHFALATVAAVAFGLLAPHMGSLAGLGATAATFYLAIRSFGNGLAAWLSEAWGWTRPERKRPFVLERLVGRLARRLWHRRLAVREKKSAPIVLAADDVVVEARDRQAVP